MSSTKLPKSPHRIKMLLLTTGLAAIASGLLASWLVYHVVKWTRFSEWRLSVAALMLATIIWAVQALIVIINWQALAYEVGPEFIAVESSTGLFKKQRTIYRYESMIAVSLRQGYFAKSGGYGEIHIQIPKLDHDVVIKDVKDPSKVLANVQARINKRNSGAHALVN